MYYVGLGPSGLRTQANTRVYNFDRQGVSDLCYKSSSFGKWSPFIQKVNHIVGISVTTQCSVGLLTGGS